MQPSFCRLQWRAQNATHSTMSRAQCAPPPQVNRADHGHLTLHICLYLVLAIYRMLDSSTRCLGMPLGRAYPEVDTLPSAYMRPVAYKPKRLNLHANEATILNLHAKVVVTCQLSSGDGRPSTSTWTAASCRLLAWYCTTCRHAHAASSSHSMHVRAIHAHKLPSAECSQHMRFPCFRTYCCMHVAEYSFLHPLALLAGHLNA